MGMMRVIVDERLFDEDFLARRAANLPALLESLDHFTLDFADGFLVVLGLGQLQQLGRVGQPLVETGQLGNHRLQACAFPAQCLGFLLFLPDRRVFELAIDFFETTLAGVEVKDTPLGPGCDQAGP
jgi:anaerobic selenocysteine-containing dehydrogenase